MPIGFHLKAFERAPLQVTVGINQAAFMSGRISPPGFHHHADALRLRLSNISVEEFSASILAARRVVASLD